MGAVRITKREVAEAVRTAQGRGHFRNGSSLWFSCPDCRGRIDATKRASDTVNGVIREWLTQHLTDGSCPEHPYVYDDGTVER